MHPYPEAPEVTRARERGLSLFKTEQKIAEIRKNYKSPRPCANPRHQPGCVVYNSGAHYQRKTDEEGNPINRGRPPTTAKAKYLSFLRASGATEADYAALHREAVRLGSIDTMVDAMRRHHPGDQ